MRGFLFKEKQNLVNQDEQHPISVDGSAELDGAQLAEKRYRILGKRYRLHGKRFGNDAEVLDAAAVEQNEENNEENIDELVKRYRLMGRRSKETVDDDLSLSDLELDKRYRLQGKRYRLMGKRYRLAGKRAFDEDDEDNEDEESANLEKRYRLMGKRYRLAGKRAESMDDEEMNAPGKRYRLSG